MGKVSAWVSARAAASLTFIALSLAGCSAVPLKPAEGHLSPEPAPVGAVPAPVQIAPLLPQPRPTTRPETYSVVVNNVRVQDLLFALARDARLQIDIHPDVTGVVTLNAIDQTLPQLLSRIARQVDMRYELDGPTLMVMRDVPYLRTYKIDFVSASRNVRMQSASSTQFGGATTGGASSSGTGSTATIEVASSNQLWETIMQNVREVLQETDKVLPAGGAGAAPPPAAAPPPPPAAPGAAAPGAPAVPVPVVAAPAGPTFREAASVIGNRESGILFVRASSRQHEKIQEFLDQVMSGVRRQVLIEATIAEVQLNNAYQRGIDWSRVRRGASGVTLQGFGAPALGAEQGVDTGAFVISATAASIGLDITMRLLETFGDVRVLSSPKVSVLNNQTALLRVTRDIVYFTITPGTTSLTVAGGGAGTINVIPSFTTTPAVAAEGFMMSVLPQISEADTIVLNVRPTIRRRVAFASDPNPALRLVVPAISNLVPVFETRELDSMLRLQSGQVAVLGGLMQDSAENTDDTIPGVRDVPVLGEVLTQRRDVRKKTELVIFLRATVIRDASIEGDYRRFRELLPSESFLIKPVPGRERAPRQ
jgi:MSHA biogenesis protein MshL